MAKYYWILCFLFSLSMNGISQLPGFFPSINESDLPDARFESPRTYTGASLFGYIDGGAELFLEYGFSGAWVNELRFMGGQYTIEIYRMNGPEEAFGIYSVSRYRCKSIPPLSPFACQTKYQLQLCSGPFYISIINSTGNTTDSSTSLKIGEAIVRKIKDKPVDITSYLPGVSPEIINRGAILAKGELGIINGAADLIDYFGDATGYCAVIIHYEDQTMLSVRFFTKEDMNAFAILHHWDPEMLLTGSGKMPTGETISKISDNHLLITIKDEMASGS